MKTIMDTLTGVFAPILKPMFFEGDEPPAGDPPADPPAGDPPAEPPAEFKWKHNLSADFANSPTMQKYEDTKEGFNHAVKAHLELQGMLGHEKIPVPKGPDDKAAIQMFRKAFKVPEKPEGYEIKAPDVQGMDGVDFAPNKFAETVHKYNLSPDQAKGLWNDYVDQIKQGYADASAKIKEETTSAINTMKEEWGDAYQSKIELGQMVINKFAKSEEQSDYLTAVLSRDPNGIRFLASLGEQFAENKIGDFKYQRFAMTPEETQRELDSIRSDMNHPYNNEKAPQADRDRAIEYVNSLIAALNKAKTPA